MNSSRNTFFKWLFDGVAVCLLLTTIGLLGFRKVSAAVDVLPRPKPTATKTPVATPRPRPLQPVTVGSSARALWLGQGEIMRRGDEYICRVACQQSWLERDLEVLQATRGGENWASVEGENVRCRAVEDSNEIAVLEAGRWPTPSESPEDSLCFLVFAEARHSY